MNEKKLAHYLLLLFVLLSTCALCPAQESNDTTAKAHGHIFPPLTIQDSKPWQRYTAKGEEFSVLMPEQPFAYTFARPQQREYKLSPFDDLKRMRIYGAYSNGAVYIIMSADNPEGKEPLELFINEFELYPVFHTGMTYEREVTRGQVKGKQYRVKSDQVSGIVQFYQTKKRVYIFEVVQDNFGKPSTEQFLSTLTLDGKTKGKDIAEGFKEASAAEASAIPQPKPATPAANEATSPPPAPKQVFSPREATRKAVVVVRPEPQYTEAARRNAVSGTVVLKGVFSSSGMVTHIRPVVSLPFGLTEKAMDAARIMKFIPAIKDGKYVSQYIQIEYNFNLY
jgi:TonB family protein